MSKRDAAIFVNRLFRQWCKIHEPHLISFKNLNLKLSLAFKFLDNRSRAAEVRR